MAHQIFRKFTLNNRLIPERLKIRITVLSTGISNFGVLANFPLHSPLFKLHSDVGHQRLGKLVQNLIGDQLCGQMTPQEVQILQPEGNVEERRERVDEIEEQKFPD